MQRHLQIAGGGCERLVVGLQNHQIPLFLLPGQEGGSILIFCHADRPAACVGGNRVNTDTHGGRRPEIADGLSLKCGAKHGAFDLDLHIRYRRIVEGNTDKTQRIRVAVLLASGDHLPGGMCSAAACIGDAGGLLGDLGSVEEPDGVLSIGKGRKVRQRDGQGQRVALLGDTGQLFRRGYALFYGVAQYPRHQRYSGILHRAVNIQILQLQDRRLHELGIQDARSALVRQHLDAGAIRIRDIQPEHIVCRSGAVRLIDQGQRGVRGILRFPIRSDVPVVLGGNSLHSVHRPAEGDASARCRPVHLQQQRPVEVHILPVGNVAVHSQSIDRVDLINAKGLAVPGPTFTDCFLLAALLRQKLHPFDGFDLFQRLEEKGVCGVGFKGFLIFNVLHGIAQLLGIFPPGLVERLSGIFPGSILI